MEKDLTNDSIFQQKKIKEMYRSKGTTIDYSVGDFESKSSAKFNSVL